MPNEHEIKSEKILVNAIVSNLWFRIPEYQRPNHCGREQIAGHSITRNMK